MAGETRENTSSGQVKRSNYDGTVEEICVIRVEGNRTRVRGQRISGRKLWRARVEGGFHGLRPPPPPAWMFLFYYRLGINHVLTCETRNNRVEVRSNNGHVITMCFLNQWW